MSFSLLKRSNYLNFKYVKLLNFLNKKPLVSYSTQVQKAQPKPDSDQNENSAIREVENLAKLYERSTLKRPQRKPFAKNLFLGNFDTEILTFPEVGEKEDLARFEGIVNPIENLKTLTGLRAPQMFGGKELNITEVCQIAETVMENFGESDSIQNENLGVQSLIKFGSQSLISKYASLITSNNFKMALCTPELTSNKSKITAKKIEDKWIINGEVPLVINGNNANIFIVVVEHEYMSKRGLKENGRTALIVERDFGGVSSTSSNLKIGKSDLSTVKFCNVSVPEENILGEAMKGEKMFPHLLTEFRLSFGPVSSSLLKNCINKFVNFCKTNESSKALINADIVFNKIAKMASTLYAMESMTYLTAGLMDVYENQDCEMEAAIVKAYTTEQCHKSILNCLNFIGSATFLTETWCRDLHESSLNLLNFHESIDSLKIIIALQGLQYAGVEMQETVTKLRNPFFYAGEIFKRMWTNRRQDSDNPHLNLGLLNYLHPSLQLSANDLEYCVHRLTYLIENILAMHGAEVISKHTNLLRLSECIIDIYATTACLGRASRSYCIGLRHGEQEMQLASIFAHGIKHKIKDTVNQVGGWETYDAVVLNNGEYLLKNGKYYPEHPTTRNFF